MISRYFLILAILGTFFLMVYRMVAFGAELLCQIQGPIAMPGDVLSNLF